MHRQGRVCHRILIVIAILVPGVAAAQENVVRIDSLTLDRAVAIALEHHPSLKAAEANISSARAIKRETLASYYPAINFSASATHTEGYFVFNPSIPARNQIYSNYSTGLTGQQLIYDFGRTSNRVGANTDFVESSVQDYALARENVVANVELAYFNYLASRRVEQVNKEAVDQSTVHLNQAKAFYNVGRRPLFDVTRAEVDLANANVALITARNQSQVSRLQLENAMGVHPSGSYSVSDSLHILPVNLSLDSAKAIADERRPDILSARARFSGLQSLVSATWSQHLPTLSASGAYNYSGFSLQLYGRWNAGVTFSLPIFQGFAIDAQVQQAQATADAAQANLRTLTENAMLDVEQQYLGVKEAQERLLATAKLVEQAEQNLQLAEKQYAAGVGTPIDVSDAQLARSNARITDIQAFYDYNSFLVRLHRALGLLH